jgi:hypothetical protein
MHGRPWKVAGQDLCSRCTSHNPGVRPRLTETDTVSEPSSVERKSVCRPYNLEPRAPERARAEGASDDNPEFLAADDW